MTAGGGAPAPSVLNTSSVWATNRLRLPREALEYVAAIPQKPVAVNGLVSTIRRAAMSRAYSAPLTALLVIVMVIGTAVYAAYLLPDVYGFGIWSSVAATVIGAAYVVFVVSLGLRPSRALRNWLKLMISLLSVIQGAGMARTTLMSRNLALRWEISCQSTGPLGRC